MTLRVLKGGVTLHARYEDAVRAYNKESDFKYARLEMTLVFGHPTDNFPLNTYRGVPVHGEVVLMTSNTGWKYLVQRFLYRNRNMVTEEDLPNLERRGIYCKLMSIRSADGAFAWNRDDSDF